jgi:DNA-binding NarL/FixJ family response regulator
LDGIQVLEWIKAQGVQLPVIVLTAHYQPANFSRAIRLGAMGFLRKEMALRMLPAAISTVMRGETIVDNSLLRETIMASSPTRPIPSVDAQGPIEELTDQETMVLSMLARGMTNADIGDALAITESTVKSHLSSIYGKLEKSDRTQAAIWAIRHGVIS